MDPFGPKALAVATTVASLLAIRAVKKKSLSTSGAIAGFAVGFLLVATGLRGLTLFFFYQAGSWATKYKKSVKLKMDQTVATSSVRGATQVFAVSVLAVGLSFYHALILGAERPLNFSFSDDQERLASLLSAAVLAHHAMSLGDTLASEMGMATSKPNQMVRLILPPFQLVPPGTNGGLTFAGTSWSIIGGCLCSLFNLGMDTISGILPTNGNLFEYALRVIAFGGICGGLGSFLDSFLGATLQMTYWDSERKMICHHPSDNHCKRIAGFGAILSNEGVNFVSVVLTTVIGGWFVAPLVLL